MCNMYFLIVKKMSIKALIKFSFEEHRKFIIMTYVYFKPKCHQVFVQTRVLVLGTMRLSDFGYVYMKEHIKYIKVRNK